MADIPKVGVTIPNLPGGERTTLQDTDLFVVEASGLTYFATLATLQEKIFSGSICPSFCGTVTIASADVLTLFTTPIQLIAAPGAGYIFYPEKAYLRMAYNSAPYSGNALRIYQNTVAKPILYTENYTSAFDVACAFNDSEATANDELFLANTATFISVASENPTTGDSDLIIDIFWRLRAV